MRAQGSQQLPQQLPKNDPIFLLYLECFSSALLNFPEMALKKVGESCKQQCYSSNKSMQLLAALQRVNTLTIVTDETMKRAARQL